jgi:hypothetical protein
LIEEDMNEGSKLLGPPYVYLYVCALLHLPIFSTFGRRRPN